MNSLRRALETKFTQSLSNDYGLNNYDEHRFGKLQTARLPKPTTLAGVKRTVKRVLRYDRRQSLLGLESFLDKYESGLQRLYEQLGASDQELLVEVVVYRLLGYKKVKLLRNNGEYWEAVETANSLGDSNDVCDPHWLHFILQRCNLSRIGYDVQLYSTTLGVAIEFILEQYAYRSVDKAIVCVEEGDVVLDLGGCLGDSALYFACKTGKQGKVYSFEFIPANIGLFNMNISLNPDAKERIVLIPFPVSKRSGDTIYFVDNGPASTIRFAPFAEQTGFATTISVDDFVRNTGIDRVDFIKMDIEGAEPIALEGAIETIRKFRPKLAIAIYHSMDDFVSIPRWIVDLNLGYRLFLGHYTIHAEETVIFAEVQA